jgi:hypothetical protein
MDPCSLGNALQTAILCLDCHGRWGLSALTLQLHSCSSPLARPFMSPRWRRRTCGHTFYLIPCVLLAPLALVCIISLVRPLQRHKGPALGGTGSEQTHNAMGCVQSTARAPTPFPQSTTSARLDEVCGAKAAATGVCPRRGVPTPPHGSTMVTPGDQAVLHHQPAAPFRRLQWRLAQGQERRQPSPQPTGSAPPLL